MKAGGIIERFRNNYYIDKENHCWNWNKCFFNSGYGRMMFNYINYRAHVLSYLLHKGNVKKGLFVCHKCDNKKCVNPDHLFLGTAKDNMQDCLKKNRKSWSGFKLTHENVLEIRNSKKTILELMRQFEVAESTIRNIKKNITYKDL